MKSDFRSGIPRGGETAPGLPRGDCGAGRHVGATASDNALSALSGLVRIEPGSVFAGEWTGSWRSRFPLARIFYVFAAGPDVGSVSDGDSQVPLRPGTWALLPPGREIGHEQPPGIDVVSIHFRAVFRGGPEPLSGCRLQGGFAPEWRDVFREIADAALAGARSGSAGPASGGSGGAGPARLPAALSMLGAIWLVLARAVAAEGPAFWERLQRERTFSPLFEAVAENPRRDFSVADMAAAMRMGEMAFAKRFASTMGESPRAWFNRHRARMAVEALLKGDKKMRAVAEDLGFCDEYYFSRFFKRHFGLSPKDWLRRMKP